MLATKELNIKIPVNISVVSNDDIFYVRIYPTSLTSIKSPLHGIVIKADEILITIIESPKLLQVVKVVLQTEFIFM